MTMSAPTPPTLPAASWRLAWQLLRRESHSSDVRLLFTALLLAVTVVAGLSAFTARLHTMLSGEAAQMLAADRVLESPEPFPTVGSKRLAGWGPSKAVF